MKFRNAIIAVAVGSLTATHLFAALSPANADFGKSAAAKHLMTKDEAKQWKGVKTDDEAKAFIDLFWARRDPTPATPANEYRATYDEAVRFADEQFKGPQPGSLSDRGKLVILFGTPSRRAKAAGQQSSTPGEAGFDSGPVATETWYYEGDKMPSYLGVRDMAFTFEDRNGTGDYRLGTSRTRIGDVAEKAIKQSLVSPQLTSAPSYDAPKPAPVVAAVAAPKAAPVSKAAAGLKTASLIAAADQIRAAEKNPFKNVIITWDEFVTGEGEQYVPVQLFIPAASSIPEAGLVFFGSVVDESGAVVASYEEPATLTKSKNDSFYEKSLTLAPGKYKAVFGLARDGAPVVASRTEMNVAGLAKDAAGMSRLILANDVYPMTVAQKPTDPYSFGGIKINPKGDRAFTRADDLWYFVEIRNPSVDTDGMPKYQIKLDVEGKAGEKKIKMGLPLQEIEAQALKGVTGHYALGSSIPLETFAPGSYTMKVKIIDTVTKQSSTLQENFTVVDGAK